MTKSKQRARQKNLVLHQNQTRLNRVLGALGVSDLHKKLNFRFRELVVGNPDPPLAWECNRPSLPGAVERVKREWEQMSYRGISSSDFVECLVPLLRASEGAVGNELMANPDRSGSYRVSRMFGDAYLVPGKELLGYFAEQLFALMDLAIWAESAVDRHYVKMDLVMDRISRFRIQSKIVTKVMPIQSGWFAGRWNYRVGTHLKSLYRACPEVTWLSRCPLDYGLPGRPDEVLPVYISDHALSRIRERLDEEWTSIMSILRVYHSLDNPVFHELVGHTDTLVEHRVQDTTKAGYFVVSRTDQAIFVKTFLSLAMRQTPEGARLHQRLRMARPDFDLHRLEKFSTFANTDIITNPTLRKIWEECGFGPFLKWAESGSCMFTSGRQEVAQDMIRYFNL